MLTQSPGGRVVNPDLTQHQLESVRLRLLTLDQDLLGELRLGVISAFYAAVARSILERLTGYPFYLDEESLTTSVGKSKTALSLLKIPGRIDSRAPAFLLLRNLWTDRLRVLPDSSEKQAVRCVFRGACLQYFERLGICLVERLLGGTGMPTLTRDLVATADLKILQELIFLDHWVPSFEDTAFDRMIRRYPEATPESIEEARMMIQRLGIPAMLFYSLAAEGIQHDYFT